MKKFSHLKLSIRSTDQGFDVRFGHLEKSGLYPSHLDDTLDVIHPEFGASDSKLGQVIHYETGVFGFLADGGDLYTLYDISHWNDDEDVESDESGKDESAPSSFLVRPEPTIDPYQAAMNELRDIFSFSSQIVGTHPEERLNEHLNDTYSDQAALADIPTFWTGAFGPLWDDDKNILNPNHDGFIKTVIISGVGDSEGERLSFSVFYYPQGDGTVIEVCGPHAEDEGSALTKRPFWELGPVDLARHATRAFADYLSNKRSLSVTEGWELEDTFFESALSEFKKLNFREEDSLRRIARSRAQG